MKKLLLYRLIILIGFSGAVYLVASGSYDPIFRGLVPTTLNDFTLAGSQPNESGIMKDPDQCDNCHGSYDLAVEPAFNWRGSMMAHAARDPLLYACMAIGNQDAPESGDLCIRCHAPKGWLEGRSTPTNGSALTAVDRESVQCHACHKFIKPTPLGVNPYPGDPIYTSQTYPSDQSYLGTLANIPPAAANGMYVADNADARRGPYSNAVASHSVMYSPFHLDAAICGTCHDVSNPVYNTVRDPQGNILGYTPNAFDQPPPSFNPYDQFPIERTYSEWLMSQYNTPGGISGTWFGGNKPYVSTCQDCHMKDVTGKGCNKNNAPVRTDLALHDMTGGNTFIPPLIDMVFPNESNAVALQAGMNRATEMLQHAATLELTVNQAAKQIQVRITNETGHKLPSGYPEGRRIWINVKAFNSLTGQTYESGGYDLSTGILNKNGAKIYEVKPGLSPGLASAVGLPAGESFHFVLNDTIYEDNRIPPRGFTNASFTAIQSPPVGYAYADGQYWDITEYSVPFYPDSVEVTLYYQTTSKEYVTFLRDENVTDNWGQVLYNLWDANGKSTPVVMNYESWSGTPMQQYTTLDLHVYLQGPFNGTDMNTGLNTGGVLPLMQPYSASPWYYTGTEAVTAIPNADVVDWILVELRETSGGASTATGSTMIARKAVFLLKDGSVVDLDGSSNPQFNVTVTQNLYVVIWHRNHLAVMSAVPLTGVGGIYGYDFATAATQAYGGANAHRQIAPGIWGMTGGDGDGSGQINNVDKVDVWKIQSGTSGYLAGDFNLNQQVNNSDKVDVWNPNTGLGTQVPD